MNEKFMLEAIKLSEKWMNSNAGWPFWAVIVKNWKIIWKWRNKVTSTNDPTAHWEITAIRNACKKTETFDLSWCEIYTSCEPCPMCYSAIYRSRIDKIYYANTESDAAKIWFDDAQIHKDVKSSIDKKDIPTAQILRNEALKVFKKRESKKDKTKY